MPEDIAPRLPTAQPLTLAQLRERVDSQVAAVGDRPLHYWATCLGGNYDGFSWVSGVCVEDGVCYLRIAENYEDQATNAASPRWSASRFLAESAALPDLPVWCSTVADEDWGVASERLQFRSPVVDVASWDGRRVDWGWGTPYDIPAVVAIEGRDD